MRRLYLPADADVPDRIEFEAGWLAYGFLLGVGYLAFGPAWAVRYLLPAWFAYAWAATFILGALAGLWGMRASLSIERTQRYRGLVAERAGVGLHAAAVSTLGASSVYIWIISPAPNRAALAGQMVLSLALVAVWMIAALRRIVRVTAIIGEMVDEGEQDGQGSNV